MVNLVEQWFPQHKSKSTEDIIIDNMCMVMRFYGISKRELDELDIPEYLLMRDYAIEQLKNEQKLMQKMNPRFKSGSRH